MTRTEILTRYRRLRQISNEHHHHVRSIIAPDVLLDWAKRLGLTEGKKVFVESEYEMTLAEDLATYQPRPGRSHPVDRYARAAQFAPGSDEALVLDAMRHARFSLWRVERRHETAGLILWDVMRGEETWMVDETMEKNPPLGVVIAGRLLRPEGFAMEGGVSASPEFLAALDKVRKTPLDDPNYKKVLHDAVSIGVQQSSTDYLYSTPWVIVSNPKLSKLNLLPSQFRWEGVTEQK